MNIYDTKPERVHINDEIYYFYFPRNGLTKHDYEPVALKEDQSNRIVISRYHWELITVWSNLIFLEDKPKISFVLPWHTPVVQCINYNMHLGILETKDVIKNIKQKFKAITLYTLFQSSISLSNIENKFVGLPISFSDILTKDLVDEKYTYSFVGLTGMAIIGPLDKLPIQIQEEIARISIRFRTN